MKKKVKFGFKELILRYITLGGIIFLVLKKGGSEFPNVFICLFILALVMYSLLYYFGDREHEVHKVCGRLICIGPRLCKDKVRCALKEGSDYGKEEDL